MKNSFKIGDIVFCKEKQKEATVIRIKENEYYEIEFLDGTGGHSGSSINPNCNSRWYAKIHNLELISENVDLNRLLIK